MSRTAAGFAGLFAGLCAPLRIIGAAMTIITTAIAIIRKPAAPVSEAVLARSGLTKAVIFVAPFPNCCSLYNASLESERYGIVTGGALWRSFLPTGEEWQRCFVVARLDRIDRGSGGVGAAGRGAPHQDAWGRLFEFPSLALLAPVMMPALCGPPGYADGCAAGLAGGGRVLRVSA
jgi:hypothetical protein